MQQVAHLHCQHFLRISGCEHVFQIKKRFGDNAHAASGPGPAAYNIKRLFDASRAQQSNRVRKPQAYPVLLGNLGRKPPMGRSMSKAGLETTCMEKPPCSEHVKVDSKNAAADDSNDWSKIFACKDVIATGATGMVLAGTLIAQETPAAMKRIRKPELVDEFFREFAILKACRHPNIVTVFSAHEVPKPAFLMELLGKSLDQSTLEKHIDNNGVRVAFSNAAAAVLYLHSVFIAHRDIKPSNLCHQVDCLSWEVKLIDFDAAEKLEESCWVCSNFEILTFFELFEH